MDLFPSRSRFGWGPRVILALDCAHKGSRLIVRKLPDGGNRTQLIRLGIIEGERIRIIERLAGGTVVIEKNRREIAIGAAMSKTLVVEVLPSEDPILSDV